MNCSPEPLEDLLSTFLADLDNSAIDFTQQDVTVPSPSLLRSSSTTGLFASLTGNTPQLMFKQGLDCQA